MRSLMKWLRGRRPTRPISSRRGKRPSLAVEPLEDRMLLSVNFPDLSRNLDNQLQTLDSTLSGANGIISRSTVALPILNTPLKDLNGASDAIKNFRSTLVSAVSGLSDSQAQSVLQQRLYNALSSVGLVSTNNDVQIPTFQANTEDVTINLHLHKSFDASQPFKFGLGLPGIPLDLRTDGAVKVSVGLDYKNLTFGLHRGTFFFGASTPGALALTVDATLAKASLTGSVGFLEVTATPNSAGPTGFHGALTMDVTSGGLANPKLTGAADVNFTLEAKFAPSGSVSFPSIATDFAMHWGFSGANPDAGATAFGDAPTVKFGDVRFGLGGFLSNLMKPLVDVVHTITTPLQPVFTVLNTPIPILTDLSNAVGWGDVSLLSLAHIADSVSGKLHALPPDWQFALDMAIKLTDVINVINNTNFDKTGNLYVSVGSFDLSGNGDLRGLAPSGDVTDLTKLNVNNLVPHLLEAINSQKVQTEIHDLAKKSGVPGADDAVTKLFDKLKALNNGVELSFPILDDPAGSVFKLLLGQDVDFAKFTAQFHIDRDTTHWTKTFPFWGPIDVKLDGSMGFDAYFSVGYDTYGLREFIKNPSHPEYIANGLYFDASKDLIDFSGDLTATAVLNAGVLGVGVQGGVHASNVSIKFHDRNGTGRVRLFAGPSDNGVGDTLFDTTGSLTADVSAYARIGIDTPLGFAGVEKSLGLGSVKLLDLTSGSIANPYKPPQVSLASETTTGILTLNVGPFASRRGFKTGERDVTYLISHAGGTKGDESVFVTAFGITHQYDHVHLILADTGSGNDTITVAQGVRSDAVLSHSGQGDAQFTYQGDGNATLSGGYGGENVLVGGAGINHLTGGDSKSIRDAFGRWTDVSTKNTLIGGSGQNFLRGGDGADNTLQGGDGPNQLTGGAHRKDTEDDLPGRDRAVNRLIAGPGDDTLQGGDGADNILIAGKGRDSIRGGVTYLLNEPDHIRNWDATNRVTWTVGDGQPKVLDANTPGGTLEVLGSDNPDQIRVSADGSNLAIGVTSNGKFLADLFARNFSHLSVDGRGGSDQIVLYDLTGTTLTDVNVNMGKVTNPDGARDEIVVYGTTGADKVLVQVEDVTAGYLTSQTSSSGGSSGATGSFGPHGSAGSGTSVGGTVGATVQPVPGQVLKLTGLGKLTIRTAMLEDHLHVIGKGGSDSFTFMTSKAAPTPDGHRGLITFEATPIPGSPGTPRFVPSGPSTFSFQENFPQNDTLQVTRDQVSSQLLPFDVRYQADPGASFSRVDVATGTGRNTVNVQSTLAGATTTIKTNGDDRINVSSDAPANAGTLDGIAGSLMVKDQSGSAGLVVSERGRKTVDNVRLTDNSISSTLLPWRVDYLGSFGHGVTLTTGTGSNTVDVGKTVAGTRTTVITGGGKDVITAHVNPNQLAHDDLVIDGGVPAVGSSAAVLNVIDEADAAVIHTTLDTGRGGIVSVSYLNGMPSTITTRHLAAVNTNPDADHSYVRSLFHAILGRNATTAELEPLVTLLHQQTAADPAARRAVIVDKLERTDEARRVLVQKWYVGLLGRNPTIAERDALVEFLLQPGTTEEQGLRMLYSGVTFSSPPGPRRNMEIAAFVGKAYQRLLGRIPTDKEVNLGIAIVGTQGPGAFAFQLVTSPEGRRAAAAADYRTLLGRLATSAELDRWTASGLDRLTIREQIEASQEFYDRGQ